MAFTARCLCALLLWAGVGAGVALAAPIGIAQLPQSGHNEQTLQAVRDSGQFVTRNVTPEGYMRLQSAPRGSWLRVTLPPTPLTAAAAAAAAAGAHPVLVVDGVNPSALTAYFPPRWTPQHYSAPRGELTAGFTPGSITIRPPADWNGEPNLLIRLDHRGPRLLALDWLAEDAWHVQDNRRLRINLVMLTVTISLLLLSLAFWATQRDASIGWFVGYMGAVALHQLIVTGEGYGWAPLAALAVWERGLWLVNIVGTLFGALFLRRFVDLPRLAPWLGRLFAGYALWLTLMFVMFALAPIEVILKGSIQFNNAVIGIMLLVAGVAAVIAWLRGSREAWIYLLGWFPLTVLVTLRSAELLGMVPPRGFSQLSIMAATAFAATVFLLGLVLRGWRLRTEHDRARLEADLDALTEVLSRRSLLAEGARLFGHNSGSAAKLAVLFLDLDRFKPINDLHGHAVGDQCLAASAKAAASALREGDLLGRYGGEEFVAILPGASLAQAAEVAERLRERVAQTRLPEVLGAHRMGVTIGIAARTPDDATFDAILSRADRAMYAGKRAGRNRVVVSDSDASPPAAAAETT